MRKNLSAALRVLVALAPATMLATTLGAQSAKWPLPLKFSGPPTKAEISAEDLKTRLYKYADDSMMGRNVGTIYHHKAVAYIEAELKRLGLKPGGTNGSYYQDFPIFGRSVDRNATFTAGGRNFVHAKDFLVTPGAVAPVYTNIPAVYLGNPYDTTIVLDTMAVVGKLIVYRTTPPILVGDTAAIAARTRAIATPAYRAYQRALILAAGRIVLYGDSIPSGVATAAFTPSGLSLTQPAAPSPTAAKGAINITTATAEALFGGPVASLRRGMVSPGITTTAAYILGAAPAGRNVIGIIPGSDPKLAGQYVVIGAHSDHVGFGQLTVKNEHDSLALYNKMGRPAGAEGGRSLATSPITLAEWAEFNTSLAEMRKVYAPRPDSIFNGADDDGSGSVSALELAEAFAKGSIKPKRSLLFIWQAGEEMGMWGSGYFMDNPTVPRDSIIADINIDMVGRGAASDVTGQGKAPAGTVVGEILHGGDKYVQLVGSRRLSTEFGDLVETANTEGKHGFKFDYNIDADGHQQNIYCRSDHWSYAKWGVPVVFFTTGGHADYHQVTDEPQYIRYDHMAAVNKLIFDVATRVANLDHRVVVDKPKPNPAPATACRQ